MTNSTRSFARALTRSRSVGSDPAAHYASQLDRLTAAFAYCSDIALTMGGKIKVRSAPQSVVERSLSSLCTLLPAPPTLLCSCGGEGERFFSLWSDAEPHNLRRILNKHGRRFGSVKPRMNVVSVPFRCVTGLLASSFC